MKPLAAPMAAMPPNIMPRGGDEVSSDGAVVGEGVGSASAVESSGELVGLFVGRSVGAALVGAADS